MAQTKRKRQTKHRGNAAGAIESRGRTGRPPTAEEKKRAIRESRREARLNREPTLKSSAQRGLLAGAFMFLFVVVTDKPKHGSPVEAAAVFAIIATALYVFVGYGLEHYFWRRRMAKKRQGQTG